MPTIHHATLKKAESLGFTLAQDDQLVVAHWPQRNQRAFGISAKEALEQVTALKQLIEHAEAIDVTATWRASKGNPRQGWLVLNGSEILEVPPSSPAELKAGHFNGDMIDLEPDGTLDDIPDDEADADLREEDDGKRINGVSTDGAIAYSEGTVTGDCPFDEDTDEAQAWFEAWDAAADAAPEEDEEKKGGSVVSEKYRQKYAELGHPTNCGDWLAQTLDNICANKTGTNLELFEQIAGLNGVDLSKYKRSGIGWQGRIRMTGRNMMARRIFAAGGKLTLPETINGGVMQAPQEWMTQQRFKAQKKEA